MKPWKLTIFQYDNGLIEVTDKNEDRVPDLEGPAPEALGKIMVWLGERILEHEHQGKLFSNNQLRPVAYCYICQVTNDNGPEAPLVMVKQPDRSPWYRWVHRSCYEASTGGSIENINR